MNTEPTIPSATEAGAASRPARSTSWIGLAVLAVLSAVAVYALYDAFRAQQAVNQQLVTQIDQLKLAQQRTERQLARSRTGQASARDVARLEEILTQRTQEASILAARLEAVEKTAMAPAPVIEYPPALEGTQVLAQFITLQRAAESGEPFSEPLADLQTLPALAPVMPVLQEAAPGGVTSESALRREMETLLLAQTNAQDEPADDPKLSRINNALRGFLSVRRKPEAREDSYAVLRAATENGASLAVLMHHVQQLPADAQVPLAEWLVRAEQHQEIVRALRAAEQALIDQASASVSTEE